MAKFFAGDELIVFPEPIVDDDLDRFIDWEEMDKLERAFQEHQAETMNATDSPIVVHGQKESPITEEHMELAAAPPAARNLPASRQLFNAAFFPYQALVIGDPVPKASPRHKSAKKMSGSGTKGNGKFKKSTTHSWTYNPSAKKHQIFQKFLMKKLRAIHGPSLAFPLFPSGTGVELQVVFAKQPPKRMFVGEKRDIVGAKLKNEYIQNNQAPLAPDTDNCLKFLLDGLKGIAWQDDIQCVSIKAAKCYDNQPPFLGRTFIQLREAAQLVTIPDGAVPHEELLDDREYMMGYIASCSPGY